MMSLFAYQSLTESGRLMTGTVEAGNPEQARQMLADMKLQVTELDKVREIPVPTAVGKNDFLLFNQQLAALTKAGIPLERGLRELANDSASGKMKRLILQIADELEQGTPLAEAMEKRRQYFPPLYANILKAGIETGRLSEMLTNLNRHIEIEQRTRRIVIESLSYPLFVLTLAAAILTFLFAAIIPNFEVVMADMADGRASLPTVTQFIFLVSHSVWKIWMVVGCVIVGLAFLWSLLKLSPAGNRFLERLLLCIPLLGAAWRNGLMARLAQAMSVLVDSGCPMPLTVRLAGQSSGSLLIHQDCDMLAGQLDQGSGILEGGMHCRILPRLFLYSVQLGSQRNRLQENLNGLGQMYAQKTHNLQGRVQTLLLPMMIIAVGTIIGLTVLAMFLPLVRTMEVLM
jgi:type IV pilus assembly protein PilC